MIMDYVRWGRKENAQSESGYQIVINSYLGMLIENDAGRWM